MIVYQEKAKFFYISGRNYSYCMYVNDAGFLQNLYYGSKILLSDMSYLITQYGEINAPKENDLNMDMAFDSMPQEYGFFGRGVYRESTALIERADGACMSRFRYSSHEILEGTPLLNGMPHARGGGKTLYINLKDDFSDAEIKLRYTTWDDSDILVRNAAIYNAGKKKIKLKKAYSFCLDIQGGEYDILRLGGRWAQERNPKKTPLSHGIIRLQSLRGCSSHQTNPFIGILKRGCGEAIGNCIGVQLIYSGSFSITCEQRDEVPIRVQGGVCDVNFSWELSAGETFETPQAALCYSSKGLGGLSRAYADFIREHIINPNWVYKRRPIVINNWEATYFDFNEEKLFQIIDAAAKIGVDTFVLDDGWFGKRDNDYSGLGDWYVNEKKLKGGLKTIIDRCKQRGLKFGLWFEPEMVSEDSDLFRMHSDWVVGKEGVQPVRGRNQLVLDFTRKEVVNYIFSAVAKVLSENDIAYVKWDMNRSITEYYSRTLPAECQGEFSHRYILGVYELAERLTRSFPNVFFEGCAGGGGRFDSGMLYYFPQIWTSDNTDAYERSKIQWGTSICYPVSSMSCHISACPNHQTQRMTPLFTRGAIASLGATGYELDLSNLISSEISLIKEQIRNYKEIDNLVLCGDLYRLLNPFEDNYFCEMLVSKDKTSAYIVGEQIHSVPNEYINRVYLYGLDKEKTYMVEENGIIASGRVLSEIGIVIPKGRDYKGWIWHLKSV